MSFQFSKLNVLVVEDTQPMQKLMMSVLGALGIKQIKACTNGEDAFQNYITYNHDVILSDWQMSPVDGLELTRRIRNSPQSPNRMVPIVLITGYAAWPRVQEARDSGVTEFLVKPFTAHDLARRLAHVIKHPRDFIDTQDFFGPDRRRRNIATSGYAGILRREQDAIDMDIQRT